MNREDSSPAASPPEPDVTVKINSDGTIVPLPTGAVVVSRVDMSQVTVMPPPINGRDTEPVSTAPLDETYRRENCFAVGGQAEIFKGEDINLRRQVAIKSLRRELIDRPDARAAFINEARITAQLDHPGIVPIYSINTDKENGLHLTMKIIRGSSLKARLSAIRRDYEQDRIPPASEPSRLAARLEIALKICEALEYAHSRNVMHCDIKPENVMLGEAGEIYLMDWGLARLIREPDFDPDKWEAPQQIAGTPRYLSPEAAAGLYCDHRADIYSLGLILYELVFLAPAFDGTDYTLLLKKIRHGRMRPLRHRFRRPVSPDLKAVVLKAIAPRREERYSRVADLAADLRHYLRGEAVSARPESWFGTLSRWCMRRRQLMLALVLGGLMLGMIGTLSTLYHRIYRDRARNRRSLAVSEALAGWTRSGYRLDRSLTGFEFLLSAAANEAMFLLSAPMPTDRRAIAQTVPGASLPTGSGGDPARIGWSAAPDTPTAHLEERLSALVRLRPRLLRTMLAGRGAGDAVGPLPAEHPADLSAEEMPMTRIYFGFDDGLFVNYPATAIPRDYDPRRRVWYRKVREAGAAAGVVWFRPYRSVEGYWVLSCAVPMVDGAGKFRGVAALDLRLSRLTAGMRQNGNLGSAVLAKYLIDGEGRIITSGTRSRRKEGAGVREFFPDEALRNTFLKRRNGFAPRREGDREIVYLYMTLASADWRYIEKLDLDELVRNNVRKNRLQRKGRRR